MTGFATQTSFLSALNKLALVAQCTIDDIFVKVDNYTAYSNVVLLMVKGKNRRKLINLASFAAQLRTVAPIGSRIRYTPETYGACVCKLHSTTLMIYQSGKIVVSGAKEISNIIEAIKCVQKVFENVLTK